MFHTNEPTKRKVIYLRIFYLLLNLKVYNKIKHELNDTELHKNLKFSTCWTDLLATFVILQNTNQIFIDTVLYTE